MATKYDPASRTIKLCGDPFDIDLNDIHFEKRWDIERPAQSDIPKVTEIAGTFPIILQKHDEKFYCIAPAERVACLKLAAEQNLISTTVKAFEIKGVDDEDADLIRAMVADITNPTPGDEWRKRVYEYSQQVRQFEGKPWYAVHGYEFLSSVTGIPTVVFWRWKAIYTKCTPEVKELLDKGTISVRTASEYFVRMPDEEQNALAKMIEGKTNKKEIADIIRNNAYDKPLSIDELTRQVNILIKAVERKEVSISSAKLNKLQFSISQLIYTNEIK